MKDNIVIRGKINGNPELYSYIRSCEIIFSLELATEITEPILKKKGDTILVHYSSHYITYVREGDEIEVIGKIKQRHLKSKNELVAWFEANKLYNDTLKFSFDY